MASVISWHCDKCGKSINIKDGNRFKTSIKNHQSSSACRPDHRYVEDKRPPSSVAAVAWQRDEFPQLIEDQEYFDESDHSVPDVDIGNEAEVKFLQYQQQLLRDYYNVNVQKPKAPFYPRTTNPEENIGKASWECYARIFDFGRQKQLSQSDGDDLLQLFEDISAHYGVKLPLPKRYESIENSCMKHARDHELQQLQNYQYCFPQRIFQRVVQPVRSVGMNVMERLCRELLQADPDEFAFEPYPQINGKPLYSYFSSGDLFRNLCNHVKTKFGAVAVPLCISISLDSATINSSRNRSECPVLYSILNFNHTTNYNLLGYAPTKLPYTVAQMNSLMKYFVNYNNIPTNPSRKMIKQYVVRQMKREYLGQILRPILDLAKTGFKAQVGSGVSAKEVIFVPYLCMIVGDSEELGSKLTGQRANLGCRCCTSTDVHVYDPAKSPFHTIRDDTEMDKLTQEGEHLFIKLCESVRMNGRGKGAKRYTKTPREKKVEQDLLNSGLCPGTNPLYEYFQEQRDLGFNSYHQAIVPDHLHTVQLGIIQYCIGWTMQIIFAVGFLDPIYDGNVSEVDGRIIHMDNLYSYEFLKPCHFR